VLDNCRAGAVDVRGYFSAVVRHIRWLPLAASPADGNASDRRYQNQIDILATKCGDRILSPCRKMRKVWSAAP
jgi:hypothetical protein